MTQETDQAHVDIDPQESEEWIDSLRAVIEREGPGRAHFLLEKLVEDRQFLEQRDIREIEVMVSSGPGQTGSSLWRR